jgi:hypothetical protein
MVYPFVQAKYDYGVRTAPVRAFLVHMAEGGGTVGYLAHDPARGVSVHYVIEYSGRIVQMLAESHASGSVDPTQIRTTDDVDHFYGVTAAKAVMGAYWNDPNSAVVSLEMEGFATDGPNAAQAISLIELVDDVRSRFPDIGLLGHRDFASYKACPGKHIDWPALGGHGPATKETIVKTVLTIPPTTVILPKVGVPVLDQPAGSSIYVTKSGDKLPQWGDTEPPSYHIVRLPGNVAGYLANGQVASTQPLPPPPPVVDCTDVVKAELDKAATRAADAVRAR